MWTIELAKVDPNEQRKFSETPTSQIKVTNRKFKSRSTFYQVNVHAKWKSKGTNFVHFWPIRRNLDDLFSRKKRKYQSSSLPVLLKDLDIDTKKLMPKRVNPSEFSRGMQSDPENPFPIFLPLHIFDNTEYDTRTPSEWVETGADQGSHKPVPGLCLLPKKDEIPKR